MEKNKYNLQKGKNNVHYFTGREKVWYKINTYTHRQIKKASSSTNVYLIKRLQNVMRF